MTKLVDQIDRRIDYLRLSITDHCNLKCRYCSPPFSGCRHLARSEILSYEELTTLAEAAVAAGISKIRITGGEPLVRKGVIEFCRMLSRIDGLNHLALTTNGVRLKELALPLFSAGVRKINISLDTLKRDRFQQITGTDHLPQVLEGIAKAEEAGFDPIKLNTVVMRGINDDEVPELAAITYRKPYHVRFIELMPLQNGTSVDFKKLSMPIGDILRQIPGIKNAQIGPAVDSAGPARLCRLSGAKGSVGFIAPLSWHFCSTCNRLRLTADGKIRSCLFSNYEIDIKGPLRRGASKKELIDIFRTAVNKKPRRRCIPIPSIPNENIRGMYAIGG